MRRYETSDYESIAMWCIRRDVAPPTPGSLPRLGYIEPGVAVGFIYRTDSTAGLLGAFITNPDARPAPRNAALEAITETILEQAPSLGIETLLVTTKVESIAARARGHGFRDLGPHILLILDVPPKPRP